MYKIILCILVVVCAATVESFGSGPYKFNRYGLTAADQTAIAQLGIKPMRTQLFMEMGYTADALKAFENAYGLKVAAAILKEPYSIELQTLLSDVVIHGTVVNIEPFLAPPYRSVVWIEVSEYLRNDYGLPVGKIPVLLKSGRDGDHYVVASREARFKPGDEAYMFLTASSLYLDLQLTGLKNSSVSPGLQILQAKSDIYFRVTEVTGVYRPGGGELHSTIGTRFSVTDLRNKVTETVKILGK